ncbi:hypothetical protein WG907_04300 [Sphingobium sp. AN558]|uniref:hypothetical protein n=1 Tax=Sphingobium sp. AN558 TaxID=3133442 RepID=UPI0030BF5438
MALDLETINIGTTSDDGTGDDLRTGAVKTNAAIEAVNAQDLELALKAPLASPAFTGTPTGITKAHVGLANADNTSDANKPVSTAQATALALKAPLASPAFTGTPTGITKGHVGLGNVDNTADADKPVSTAQAGQFALKAPYASPAFTGTPTAPTPTAGDSTTKISTTSFVGNAIATLAALLASITSSQGAALVGKYKATASQVPSTVEAEIANFVWATTQYGADPTGAVDCVASILAAATERLPYGGEIRFPAGVFKIATSFTLPDGIVIVGSGTYATVFVFDANAVITTGAANTFRNIRLHGGVTRTLGKPFVKAIKNFPVFERVNFTNYAVGVEIGDYSQPITTLPRFDGCHFSQPQAGAGNGGIIAHNYAGFSFKNGSMTGAYGIPQPDFGIRLRNGDTAQIADSNLTGHGKTLWVDTPASQNAYAITCTNVYFDSSGAISSGTNVSNVEITPAGGVHSINFIACWFGLSANASGCVLAPTGAGVINAPKFIGCEALDNAVDGILVNGAGVKDLQVAASNFGSNGYGIRFVGAPTNINVRNNTMGTTSGRGANLIAIEIVAGAAPTGVIDGNNLKNNTLTSIENLGSSTGAQLRITNNDGYNDQLPIVTATVGASPWTYTAGCEPVDLYLIGGTISDVTLNASTIASSSVPLVRLKPGQAVAITYSVAPVARAVRN